MAISPGFVYASLAIAVYSIRWIYITYTSRLNEEEEAFLYKNLLYYRCLTLSERKEFNKRVAYYLSNKEWIGRGGFEPNPQMKLLLAAIVVKITFGFKQYSLPHFQTVFIYPRQYFSTITGRMHKGEVNLHGMVVVNWQDFEEGVRIHDNGVNLGIHEFAHALYFENLKDNGHYFFIDKPTLQNWYDMAAGEVRRYVREKKHYFRDYAFTNKEEFWAVSAEYFFEQPEEFKRQLPEFYDCMVRTFNQDPAAIYAREGQVMA